MTTKITSWVLIGIFELLSWLPIRWLRLLAGGLGAVLWFGNSRSRTVTEENLAICFPSMDTQQRSDLAKLSIKHLAMTALELGPIWRRPLPALRRTIKAVEGIEHFQEALAKGKGVIILAPHIGAWELFSVYLGDKEPFTALYQPPDNPAMHDLINAARSRTGIKVAPTNTRGVKILLQNLKKGEVVGILPDQVPPAEGGEFAPFFGVPALTTTLVSNLAKRTGAQVVLGAALRITHSGEFEIIFSPVPETIASKDIHEALKVLNKSVENCVESAPEQYQWEYKRFKKQPGGERKYYQKN